MSHPPADTRWPIYRFPHSKLSFPDPVKLILPRARRSEEYDEINVKPEDDAYMIIYKHYSEYLPDPHKYPNYCGNTIAVRRHEALSCDPYFGGFVVTHDSIVHIVIYDDYLHDEWSLIKVGADSMRI